MSRRRMSFAVSFARDASKIEGPGDAGPVLARVFQDLPREQESFVILLMNARGRPIEARCISIGTLTTSLVHPREVFAPAIEKRAAQMIIAHNHPSGELAPSDEDIALTDRLKQAGELLGIPIVDHIVLGANGDGSSFQWRSIS